MLKRTVAQSVFVFVLLLICQIAKAAVVEVDVTIKTVDVKARGITVTYETKLGQKSIDLDVSRKAEIMVNGKPGKLDAVRPGQKAKVSFEKELQIVTKITATGANKATNGKDPELIECSELNDLGDNDHPWLSQDGLTIYWDREVVEDKDSVKNSIWTARRDNLQSMFTDKKSLFPGGCPTVSADGLEMVFMRWEPSQQKMSLHATSRDTVKSSFRRPSEIAELAGFLSWGPCLSADGLTLYFTHRTSTPQGSMVVYCTRPDRSSPWSSAKTFAKVALGCPSVTSDGLHLLGHDTAASRQNNAEHSHLLIWTRPSAQAAFSKCIEIDGFPGLRGQCPRYVPPTKELFFVRESFKNGQPERRHTALWIIKNFSLPSGVE